MNWCTIRIHLNSFYYIYFVIIAIIQHVDVEKKSKLDRGTQTTDSDQESKSKSKTKQPQWRVLRIIAMDCSRALNLTEYGLITHVLQVPPSVAVIRNTILQQHTKNWMKVSEEKQNKKKKNASHVTRYHYYWKKKKKNNNNNDENTQETKRNINEKWRRVFSLKRWFT